jgi:hypothetical protein
MRHPMAVAGGIVFGVGLLLAAVQPALIFTTPPCNSTPCADGGRGSASFVLGSLGLAFGASGIIFMAVGASRGPEIAEPLR